MGATTLRSVKVGSPGCSLPVALSVARLTRRRAATIIPDAIRELNMKTEKKENRQHQPVEKYEQPEVVNMGKVVDLTHGNTGSSTDTNAQTIPVQK
jgi:hypothetical protein